MSKWRVRASLFLALLAIFVLADEAVTEGYVFDPADLVSLGMTHEKVFVILIALALLIGLRRKDISSWAGTAFGMGKVSIKRAAGEAAKEAAAVALISTGVALIQGGNILVGGGFVAVGWILLVIDRFI